MSYILDQIYRDFCIVGGNIKDGFPFYNIVKKDDRTFEIRIALAGYNMSNVEVIVDGEHLVISSAGVDERSETFVHKGYTGKPFVKKFSLNSEAEVKGADFQDGVLTVFVERIVPEKNKVRQIKINGSKPEILNG